MMNQKRKQYIVPAIKMLAGTSLPILYTASAGFGGEDDGNQPIDAKQQELNVPVEFNSVWEE